MMTDIIRCFFLPTTCWYYFYFYKKTYIVGTQSYSYLKRHFKYVSTDSIIMFSWRNKKNIYLHTLFIWNNKLRLIWYFFLLFLHQNLSYEYGLEKQNKQLTEIKVTALFWSLCHLFQNKSLHQSDFWSSQKKRKKKKKRKTLGHVI